MPLGSPPLISARALDAGYGGLAVVHGLDLEVHAGEVVALLGPNGAGKTTTLLTLAGDLPPLDGEVCWRGTPTRTGLDRRARDGLGFVPEGRSAITRLTMTENLRLARGNVEAAFELFPELRARGSVRAGMLSGGEQQMLVLARALSREPAVVLADELSLGLAPLVVDRLLQALRDAASGRGVGVLLVEQHVGKALRYADRVYVLRQGRVAMSGTAEELSGRLQEIEDSYLSV
jgi:ABC-type branched-subunit amino acid transport system ATPase component